MKTLIISTDNFEDTELLVPYYRLKEEGIDVDIASIKKGGEREDYFNFNFKNSTKS